MREVLWGMGEVCYMRKVVWGMREVVGGMREGECWSGGGIRKSVEWCGG